MAVSVVFMRSGPGCATTSQPDPPPRLHPLGANWRPRHLKLKRSLFQQVGCTAEVVTQSGTSVHLGRVARDWRTFCHLGSKSTGTLSCNPALVWIPTAFFVCQRRSFVGPMLRPCVLEQGAGLQNMLGGLWACACVESGGFVILLYVKSTNNGK